MNLLINFIYLCCTLIILFVLLFRSVNKNYKENRNSAVTLRAITILPFYKHQTFPIHNLSFEVLDFNFVERARGHSRVHFSHSEV